MHRATLRALLLAAAIVPPAQAQTVLPFLDAPARSLTSPPHLFVAAGGRRVRAVMDTGSTGAVLGARSIPGWDTLPSLGPGRVAYSSSGRVMEGRWVVTPLTIAGADGASVRTEPMPVLAVTRLSCLRTARSCVPSEMPRVAMLGIGFARQADMQAQGTPDRNPFLRLPEMTAGTLRSGYVVTRQAVQVGLPAATPPGFATVRLARPPGSADWSPIPGCVRVGTTPPACGTLLFDTGVAGAFLTVPRDSLAGALASDAPPTLRDGIDIAVQLGDSPRPAFRIRTGDASDPLSPTHVTLVRPGQAPTFLNTGLHVLNGFDLLYDARQGIFGLRPTR